MAEIMGLFDYFSKDAGDQRKREACRKKLSNMYYQKVDRLAAADQAAALARQGDAEAVGILLLRFEHLAPNHTSDREEKDYVMSLLVDLGEHARPVVEEYIRTTSSAVWWAIQAYTGLVPRRRVAELLAEVLEGTDNGYVRHPAKKAGLVQMAAEYADERLKAALVPFLEDHEESVRFDAVQALLRHPDDHTGARLLPRLLDSEESARVRTAVADALRTLEWPLPDDVDVAALQLPDAYGVSPERRLVRRATGRESLTLNALRDSLAR